MLPLDKSEQSVMASMALSRGYVCVMRASRLRTPPLSAEMAAGHVSL